MRTFTRTTPIRLKIFTAVVIVAVMAAACGGGGNAATTTSTSPGSDDSTPTTTPAPLEMLRIHYPDTIAFSAPFKMMDPNGPISKVTKKVEQDLWTTPDVLRALLVSDKSDVTAVPTYLGANLANNGVDVRMAAVLVWGLLYVVGPDGATSSWESLKGKTIMVPFPNDMPDIVFQYLAKANGLDPKKDLKIQYYATPLEVVSNLISGKEAWAVIPEHVVTLAIAKAGEEGHPLTRVLDLQKEWAGATGGSARIPQAGIVVPGRIAERDDVIAALLDELDTSVALINKADDATVAKLTESSGLTASMVKSLIPNLHLDVVPGADARKELERFFSELAEFTPEIIGGKLPPASFYLSDPR